VAVRRNLGPEIFNGAADGTTRLRRFGGCAKVFMLAQPLPLLCEEGNTLRLQFIHTLYDADQYSSCRDRRRYRPPLTVGRLRLLIQYVKSEPPGKGSFSLRGDCWGCLPIPSERALHSCSVERRVPFQSHFSPQHSEALESRLNYVCPVSSFSNSNVVICTYGKARSSYPPSRLFVLFRTSGIV